MKKSKSGKKIVSAVTIMIIIAVLAVGAYYYFNNRPESTAVEKKSDVESILDKDFETSYPETPTEVIKMYCRITQYMYNHSLEDETLEALMDKMRELFSEELLKNNVREKHLEDLKTEMKQYQKNKSKIANYTVEKNSSVVYKTVDKEDFATLEAAILVNNKENYTKSNEEFILKKEDKKWKIIGWKLVESTDLTDKSQVEEFDKQAEKNDVESAKETEQAGKE